VRVRNPGQASSSGRVKGGLACCALFLGLLSAGLATAGEPRSRKNPFWSELGQRALASCASARIETALAGARQIDDAENLAEQLREAAGRPLLLRDIEASGLDLRGIDLAGAYLGDVVLHDVNLAGANLDGAVLERVRLLNSDLSRATLRQARICDSDLTGSRLNKADLGLAAIVRSNLSQLSARKSRWEEAVLHANLLAGADFRAANLRGALLFCDEASLGEPCPAQVGELDLANAELSGATLAALDLPINLAGSRLDDATLDARYLTAALSARFETLEIAPSAVSEAWPVTFSAQEIRALLANWRANADGSFPAWLACVEATDPLEQAVCGDPDVAALSRLASRHEGERPSGERRSAWQQRLTECPKLNDVSGCLKQGYVQQLLNQIDNGSDTAAASSPPAGLYGPAASFPPSGAEDEPQFPPARLQRLLRRSLEFLTVRPLGNGAIDVEAFAPGRLAHECALSARFVYDPGRRLFTHRDGGAEVQLAFLPPYLLFLGGREFCGEEARWSVIHVLRRPL